MRPRRIYVASSWRNPIQPAIVDALRAAGHEVYDFRNPAPGQKGLASWRDCGGEAAADGPGTGARTIPAYLEAIGSPRAIEGFNYDKHARLGIVDEWADCALLLDVFAGLANINTHQAKRAKMDLLWRRTYEAHPDGYLFRTSPYSVKPDGGQEVEK